MGVKCIPQRAADVPIGPANAKLWGGSTAVTRCARWRVAPNISFARCSTRAPGISGPPPWTQHASTVGAHSGQRPTSQMYVQTSVTLPAIARRLSDLIVDPVVFITFCLDEEAGEAGVGRR
jgi:hypothetical protein